MIEGPEGGRSLIFKVACACDLLPENWTSFPGAGHDKGLRRR